jgi:electron-transferring-flavoprotein dehydrogenase
MFQKFKTHPYIAEILKDGKPVQFGAKSVPVTGYYSIPRLYFDGGLLIGDSAGLFNGMKIKGIHYAMKSGMLAAESVFNALGKDDFSAACLSDYEKAVYESYIGKQLYKVRNFRQSFEGGLLGGLFRVGIQYLLGGRDWSDRLKADPDHTRMKSVADYYGTDSPSDEQKGIIKYDGELTFDKETDVYHSGSTHEEAQPPHLRIADLNICYTKCRELYHNPCVNFCPAGVYEMEVDEETGKLNLKLNFSNCVHCKTCDIKDPFENITWVPPEGGGGPKYTIV